MKNQDSSSSIFLILDRLLLSRHSVFIIIISKALLLTLEKISHGKTPLVTITISTLQTARIHSRAISLCPGSASRKVE